MPLLASHPAWRPSTCHDLWDAKSLTGADGPALRWRRRGTKTIESLRILEAHPNKRADNETAPRS